MLKEAIYPSLLCAAGREGDVEKLEQLKQNVSKYDMGLCIFLLSWNHLIRCPWPLSTICIPIKMNRKLGTAMLHFRTM